MTADLSRRRVLVVGLGGIGGPAALALAAEGIGTLGLCDPDRVALDNLPRQVLYEDDDVGEPKTEAARKRLARRRPDLVVETYPTTVEEAGAVRLFSRFDLVIDGTDRLETKLGLHAEAVRAGAPIAVGAALGLEGHAVFVRPGGRPCYRCFFRDAPPSGGGLTCAEAGVWPPLPGMIGALLSQLGIAYLCGDRGDPAGRLYVVDAKSGRVRVIAFGVDPSCPACGAGYERLS